MSVDGHEGLWISGAPHTIAYLDPDGRYDTDSVRRAGNVLLWVGSGVTYRIEGLDTLAQAMAQARALR